MRGNCHRGSCTKRDVCEDRISEVLVKFRTLEESADEGRTFQEKTIGEVYWREGGVYEGEITDKPT